MSGLFSVFDMLSSFVACPIDFSGIDLLAFQSRQFSHYEQVSITAQKEIESLGSVGP